MNKKIIIIKQYQNKIIKYQKLKKNKINVFSMKKINIQL